MKVDKPKLALAMARACVSTQDLAAAAGVGVSAAELYGVDWMPGISVTLDQEANSALYQSLLYIGGSNPQPRLSSLHPAPSIQARTYGLGFFGKHIAMRKPAAWLIPQSGPTNSEMLTPSPPQLQRLQRHSVCPVP